MSRSDPPVPAALPASADDDVWRWATQMLVEEVARLPEEARAEVAQGILARAGHRIETFDFVPELRATNRRVVLAGKIVSRLAAASLETS